MSRVEQTPGNEDPTVQKERLMVHAESIPTLLKEYPQWVCWSYVFRGEGKKPDKRPINPRNLHNAGVHWPNTWGGFDEVYKSYLTHRADGMAGVGFVLTKDNPFVGIDVDHCVQDGSPSVEAQAVIDHFASYTELSPSGAGLRIFVSSPDFTQNVRRPALEVYAHSRFLTVTGTRIAGSPVDINSVDPSVLQSLLPPQSSPAPSPTPHEAKPFAITDDELWRRIFIFDRQGAAHEQRFRGQTIDQDHSLTVLRLLNALARWTGGDAVRMRQMMLMSPLANDKWFSRRGTVDWLDYQIADAIRYVKGER
jgi:putative DNA primase/helicase